MCKTVELAVVCSTELLYVQIDSTESCRHFSKRELSPNFGNRGNYSFNVS